MLRARREIAAIQLLEWIAYGRPPCGFNAPWSVCDTTKEIFREQRATDFMCSARPRSRHVRAFLFPVMRDAKDLRIKNHAGENQKGKEGVGKKPKLRPLTQLTCSYFQMSGQVLIIWVTFHPSHGVRSAGLGADEMFFHKCIRKACALKRSDHLPVRALTAISFPVARLWAGDLTGTLKGGASPPIRPPCSRKQFISSRATSSRESPACR